MDWIDEWIEFIKKKIKRSNIKQTLSIYLVCAIFGVILCYTLTVHICSSWRSTIYSKYQFEYESKNGIRPGQTFYFDKNRMTISDVLNYEEQYIGGADKTLIAVLDIVESFSILLYAIIAIWIVTKLFYKNNLKEPLYLLTEEAKHISRDDYSFSCRYESNDEMSMICDTFDTMRLQLIENKKALWDLMEEQRRLNAAFAHDIRTPLTVLKGYTELLTNYYPKGMIGEDKLCETLYIMDKQLDRLKGFSESMKNIHSIEQIEFQPMEGSLQQLMKHIEDSARGLMLTSTKNIKVRSNTDCKSSNALFELFYDEKLILEVVENLLSNGLRYADKLIEISFMLEEKHLHIYVKDDGKGFSPEELYQADKPYYSSAKEKEHFGLGLTICKILCKKHKGDLSFANSTTGGAIVSASFYVK